MIWAFEVNFKSIFNLTLQGILGIPWLSYLWISLTKILGQIRMGATVSSGQNYLSSVSLKTTSHFVMHPDVRTLVDNASISVIILTLKKIASKFGV